MTRTIALFLTAVLVLSAADKVSVRQLTELSKNPGEPHFREALVVTLGQAAIEGGTAWKGDGTNFVWAVQTPGPPSLLVDGKPGPAMKRVPGSDLWFATGQVAPAGKLHWFEYRVNGKQVGGNTQAGTTDYTKAIEFPVFTPDSLPQQGVPKGKLSDKMTFTSQVYEGMTNDYWVYVPSQYDPSKAAALMVFQDGQSYIDPERTRTLDVLDNLIHQKKIPVMIAVFISPGFLKNPNSTLYKAEVERITARGGKGRGVPDTGVALRSIQYDTVSDRYARYLRDEILPEVYKKYNIRKDSYSRGITGLSSGAICALNVAWQQPDQFSRVLSWIGSYTGIQWKPNELDSGQAFPTKVRKETKRNIRIWVQDGLNDLENVQGSWPMQAIEMVNSFKLREYDFHFSFGNGTHNTGHGSAELPKSLAWLWRDYDPDKTEQTYVMDADEKSKPFFRVTSLNREAN